MPLRQNRPRRSVLYVPADNRRALIKSLQLSCDTIIYDLEDAVLPEQKHLAREMLRDFIKTHLTRDIFNNKTEIVIRINPLSSPWGQEDLMAARAILPSAILIPKLSRIKDVCEINNALSEMDTPLQLRLWAMIETALGILNLPALAEYASVSSNRLDCLIAGTNDLIRETGLTFTSHRSFLSPWLSQIVLAARAYDLEVIDGVYNDFSDMVGFEQECQEGRAMGFDGKTLIHPNQIDIANRIFGITDKELIEAKTIIKAFETPKNKKAGVIQLNGKMVERLHLKIAQKRLLKAEKMNKPED